MSKERIVIGVSSGVDSPVTAWLLKQQSYDVIGLFMKNWKDDDDSEYYSTRQDWIDMISVADLISVDIKAVSFAAECEDRVFADFLREYSTGRTPNPDVLCNAEIKFKTLPGHAMALGADTIATGHYARAHKADGRFELLTMSDHAKDQSYFLHCLNQAQLLRALFPLGEMPETRVREIAAEISLSDAKKKGSTGICFIGERSFHGFLDRYLPTKPGPIRTPDDKTTSEHIGLAFYTLGQRKSISIGGSRDGNGDTWYVARKDITANALCIMQEHDRPWLLAHTVHADDLSWVAGQALVEDTNLGVEMRYRQADAPCMVVRADNDALTLAFPEAQWAVAPGRSAVLHDGEVCLDGGIVSAAEPAVIKETIA